MGCSFVRLFLLFSRIVLIELVPGFLIHLICFKFYLLELVCVCFVGFPPSHPPAPHLPPIPHPIPLLPYPTHSPSPLPPYPTPWSLFTIHLSLLDFFPTVDCWGFWIFSHRRFAASWNFFPTVAPLCFYDPSHILAKKRRLVGMGGGGWGVGRGGWGWFDSVSMWNLWDSIFVSKVFFSKSCFSNLVFFSVSYSYVWFLSCLMPPILQSVAWSVCQSS